LRIAEIGAADLAVFAPIVAPGVQRDGALDVLVLQDGELVLPVKVQGTGGPVLKGTCFVVTQGNVDALERVSGEFIRKPPKTAFRSWVEGDGSV
jgi:hypothetical protein